MNKILTEMQQLRLLLARESNFDLAKAEKVYSFIIGKQPKPATVSATTARPDGIYFILSPSNMIHESLATDEDKRNSIAIGVKMGNRFANVVLHDAVGGKEIALCLDDITPRGSKEFSHKIFKEAISNWDGMANTNDIRGSLNPEINLGKNGYIPSMAQLHLILLNINEVNKALVEAGGEPMKDDWYWSSTEYNRYISWNVCFYDGTSYYNQRYVTFAVRTSIACEI